jgi:hypothetical protein
MLLAFALLFASCAPQADEPEVSTTFEHSTQAAAAPSTKIAFEVPPPPFTPGVFPCSDCHDPTLPVKTKRRTLKTAHQEIELHHDEEHRWCLDCHDTTNRDVLHLASGETVPFEESYRLCGQCHGDKYRDWRAGVHGRRTGNWDGEKQYLLCVSCHNAHSPHFAPLTPEAPPPKPERTP